MPMSSRTLTNRSDHQVAPIAPRVLRALRPPSTGRGRAGGGYQVLLTDGSPRQGEHVAQVAGGQFGQPAFAVADHQSARAFFSSIISSIFSSRVPVQMNLRTCTLRRCPIRKARSVAWFSTAGFHHRSRWITWLAAVRFSPVPPAFSDSRKIGGPSPDWNLVTSSSRRLLGVPPCR